MGHPQTRQMSHFPIENGTKWDIHKPVRFCSEVFGFVRKCSVLFGSVRFCSEVFDFVRKCSVLFGSVRPPSPPPHLSPSSPGLLVSRSPRLSVSLSLGLLVSLSPCLLVCLSPRARPRCSGRAGRWGRSRRRVPCPAWRSWAGPRDLGLGLRPAAVAPWGLPVGPERREGFGRRRSAWRRRQSRN